MSTTLQSATPRTTGSAEHSHSVTGICAAGHRFSWRQQIHNQVLHTARMKLKAVRDHHDTLSESELRQMAYQGGVEVCSGEGELV